MPSPALVFSALRSQLWLKADEHFAARMQWLYFDACLHARLRATGCFPHAQSTSTPSGLNNLGNTCYVNAALQCLFSIRAFREGLFSIDADIAQQPVVAHIRQPFA